MKKMKVEEDLDITLSKSWSWCRLSEEVTNGAFVGLTVGTTDGFNVSSLERTEVCGLAETSIETSSWCLDGFKDSIVWCWTK